jgi:hypothetical protein
VALSDNAALDAAVVANDAVIAAYASRADRPQLPFWPLLFANVTLRLLGSDDFPAQAKRQAARDLSAVAAAGALKVSIAARYPLQEIAKAHDHVDAGSRGRILLTLPTDIPRRTARSGRRLPALVDLESGGRSPGGFAQSAQHYLVGARYLLAPPFDGRQRGSCQRSRISPRYRPSSRCARARAGIPRCRSCRRSRRRRQPRGR